jgi:hypothetical protein
MPKPLVITKIQYIGTGRAEISKLSGMAKYFQYRDGSVRRGAFARADREAREAGLGYPQGVSDYVRPKGRDIRWVDRGMGDTHRKITRKAVETAGGRTTARMWIISPDPELMEHIPEDRRMEVLGRTTERAIEYWYDDNGWGSPQYSYVMHDKQIVKKPGVEFGEDKLQGEDRRASTQMLHTHVVTPGTYDLGDGLGRIDHVVRKPHIRNLHQVTHEVFLGEMERVLGRERVTQIIHERDERDLDNRYPDRKQRQRQREFRDRVEQMQRVRDMMSIIKREQARKRRKKEKRKLAREQKRRQRQEDMRIYVHYHHRRERQARQQSYAGRQVEWERKRRQWREEHLDDLHYARLEEETRQMREARTRREAERAQRRKEQLEIYARLYGRKSLKTGMSFSETELDELIALGERAERSPDLDI